MQLLRLVVFDFDGTLADSAPWFLSILNSLAQRHRFKVMAADDIERLRRLPNREIIKAFGIRPWQLPFIARDLRKRSAAAAGEISLFADVGPLLEQLRARGIVVAIVSSNGEATVRHVLGPVVDAVAYFRCGASLFGKRTKLIELSRVTSIAPKDILCIGDEVRDIEAAHSAGMLAAAVTWGYAHESALASAGPDALFHSVAELRATLLSSRS